MSGGSKTQTTVQQQNNDPWAPAQPALQNVLSGATAAYNSGTGSQVYGGQRVAGLGNESRQALSTIWNGADAGQDAAQAGNGYLTGLLGGGGSTSAEQAALKGLSSVPSIDGSGVSNIAGRMADTGNTAYTVANGLASGAYNLDTSGYDRLGAGISGQTQSEKSLQDVADGKYLSGGNPYLDAVIGRSQGEAASKIAQQMGAAGRGGSGRYAATITDSLGAIGTNARYQDYTQERNWQAQAASQIDSARDARTGVQAGLLNDANSARLSNAGLATQGAGLYNTTNAAALSGANAVAGIDAQNVANQIQTSGMALSAAQGDRAASLQGLGMVGNDIANLQVPGQTMAGVGAAIDAETQANLDAQQQVFAEQQASPWKQLGLYSQLVDPVAGLGGSSTGTSVQRTPQPSILQQALGFGLAGAGVASKFI